MSILPGCSAWYLRAIGCAPWFLTIDRREDSATTGVRPPPSGSDHFSILGFALPLGTSLRSIAFLAGHRARALPDNLQLNPSIGQTHVWWRPYYAVGGRLATASAIGYAGGNLQREGGRGHAEMATQEASSQAQLSASLLVVCRAFPLLLFVFLCLPGACAARALPTLRGSSLVGSLASRSRLPAVAHRCQTKSAAKISPAK